MPSIDMADIDVDELISEFGRENMFVRRYIVCSIITKTEFTQDDAELIRDALINYPEITDIIVRTPISMTMAYFIAAFSSMDISRCTITNHQVVNIMHLLIPIACRYGNIEFLKLCSNVGVRAAYENAVFSNQLECVKYIRTMPDKHSSQYYSDLTIISSHVAGDSLYRHLMDAFKLEPLVVAADMIDIFKTCVLGDLAPSSSLISSAMASQHVDCVKYLCDKYSINMQEYAKYIRHLEVAEYFVSINGRRAFTSSIGDCTQLTDKAIIYAIKSGYSPTIYETVLFSCDAAILRAMFESGVVDGEYINEGIVQNIECITIAHEHGYPITHDVFQYAVSGSYIPSILYIHALHPTWTASIGIWVDSRPPTIPAIDECLRIGCTFHEEACATAVKHNDVRVLAHMHACGASIGDATEVCEVYNAMQCAIFIVGTGHTYTTIHERWCPTATRQYLIDANRVKEILSEKRD